jgi:hypothetical protein
MPRELEFSRRPSIIVFSIIVSIMVFKKLKIMIDPDRTATWVKFDRLATPSFILAAMARTRRNPLLMSNLAG